jgi:cardiolipin synthase
MFAVDTWLVAGGAGLAWFLPGAVASAHAIMYKRDPRSSAIWVVVSFLIPVGGPWLYWAFGINRIERKATRRLGRRERPFDAPARRHESSRFDPVSEPVGHLTSLRTVADRVTRLPLLAGNSLTPLHNGERAYPRMLAAIRGAERTITLASYIFDWDDVGREFVRVLDETAARGVRVHVLVDGIGALGSFSRMGRLLLKSGAEVRAFFPLRFPLGRLRINLRNHRKLLVVDGTTGFTGGMNISARHLVERGDARRVVDLHFEITGPVVAEMQHAFAEDWTLATGTALEGDGYFPHLAPTGPAHCRGISSGPDEDFEINHWIVLAAFTAARQRVRILTPYFVPTGPLITAMSMAALRGVEVSLLLPSQLDLPYMRWAADAYLWQLLEHGIRVYRHPPPFVHTKLLLVDERWTLLGSSNLDRRSFRLNFEFNVEAYDVDLARDLSRRVDEHLARAEEVSLEEIDSRPLRRRFRDSSAKLLSPFL